MRLWIMRVCWVAIWVTENERMYCVNDNRYNSSAGCLQDKPMVGYSTDSSYTVLFTHYWCDV